MRKLALSILFAASICATPLFAEEKPSAPEQLSDKAAAQRADDVKEWEEVDVKKKKKKTNKLYQEPFGPIETPPAGRGVEIDNQPQNENYDSSPFDRN